MNIDQTLNIINSFLDNNFDFEESELIEALKVIDDYYFNDNEIIDDVTYDAFRMLIKQTYPNNVYFLGVGSSIRGGKIPLPYPMPSLNQIEIGQIKPWIDNTGLNYEDLVISDKMDGASITVVYDYQGNLQIGYSRGDGTQGADITRHLLKIKNLPQKITHSMAIRCEVEISEDNFKILQNKMVRSSNGQPYKNARNMVSGLMNASSNNPIVYEYLDVFAYSILNVLTTKNKKEQLEYLTEEGFKVPFYTVKKGIELNDTWLADYLNKRRGLNNFAIDGVVIDVNSAERRTRLDADIDTGNPKSAIKYKVADASNQHVATVELVEWNVSKHGYLKPRVVFTPFPLCGVTVTHTTGYNAKFIKDNNIGKGTQCLVSRCGDVVPNIMSIVKSTTAELPTEHCEWNETGVDLVLVNKHSNDEMKVQQLLDFCASLDFPHLKEGNVRMLYEAGIKTPVDVVKLSMVQATLIIGANGIKAYHGIKEKLTDVALSDVMGAFPAFGRGIGQRKMKKLVEALGEDFTSWAGIANVEGFDTKTSSLVMAGIDEFKVFYDDTKDLISYKGRDKVAGGKLDGQKIIMTGFRDKALEKQVEDLGGENQSAVSAKTTIVIAADPDSTSGKAQKARDLNASGKANIKVMSVKQFKEFIA